MLTEVWELHDSDLVPIFYHSEAKHLVREGSQEDLCPGLLRDGSRRGAVRRQDHPVDSRPARGNLRPPAFEAVQVRL